MSNKSAGVKISVCMAVHNGEAYLSPQLESILRQLQTCDELIVVDDASEDNSASILGGFCDPKMRVYRNEFNLGVLATFEKALQSAKGDILFLSDQDDIWLPGKVNKIMEAFSENREITLVASDAQIVDERGSVISESFFAQRGRFTSGVLHNIFKNKYLGCTLAFRRSMLVYFLPIPADVPMHDMWFGVVNDFYGKTRYIDLPLVAYRRHGKNLSPSVAASYVQRLVWRWCLVKNLVLRVMHCGIKTRDKNAP